MLSEFGSVIYDGAGNRKSLTSNLPSSSNYSGTSSFIYDVKDQLKQEISTKISGYTNNFSFDSSGNQTSIKGVTQTFNSNNQNTASTFSLNGNPTTYKGSACTFDAENRMTSYGSSMTAGYLAGGLRAWKQSSTGRTYFLYADGVIPICELDSSGNVTAVNSMWSSGLLSRHTSIGSTFYCFDQQGSSSHRLDSSGNIQSVSTFDAFGVRATNDTSGDPYAGFGGEFGYRSDSETGLQLLGFRYYDTAAGRFVNRDPESYEGGINVYNYGYGNPVTYIDADGSAAYCHERGIPGHWFIHLGIDCKLTLPGRHNAHNCHAIGLYPRGNPWNSPGNINDGEWNDKGWDVPKRRACVDKEHCDTRPEFEKALCKCIKGILRDPPRYHLQPPPYTCIQFSDEIWNCALRQVALPRVPPTHRPTPHAE